MRKIVFLAGMVVLPSLAYKLGAQSGDYLSLNGVNSYMVIPNHADFQFTTSEEFTVSYWVNFNTLGTTQRTVSKRNQNLADKSGYETFSNNATQFYGLNTPKSNNVNAYSVYGNKPGSTGKWYHIAMVVSRSGGITTISMYQDGALVGKSTNNPTDYAVTSAADVYIGRGETTTVYMNGKVDNLRFYKKGMTQAEIQADMTATVSPSTPGLVAAYDFENTNISGNQLKDISGKGHTATLYNVQPSGLSINQDNNFTGRGNDNEEILKIGIDAAAGSSLKGLTLNLNGTTNFADVEKIKVYSTGNVGKFDPRSTSGYTLVGEANAGSGDITISSDTPLQQGTNFLWITYKIAANAAEGNKVDAVLKTLTIDGTSKDVSAYGNPDGSREIILKRKLVIAPGDYGSVSYRIPAIITAADGSLVALTDNRKLHSGDLAANIDVIAQRSTNGGATWSQPVTVAQGTSTATGFGDASLLKTKSGKLVALFAGYNGFFQSTPSNPIRLFTSSSTDNGITWDAPKDITSQIYGQNSSDPVRQTWYGIFPTSGQGLTMRDGRLMVVIPVRETSSNTISDYAIYSDDEGLTWNVSQKAVTGGDEGKVVELDNGNILMNVRGTNRIKSVSTDRGITWSPQTTWTELSGNPTNGDMIRYTSVKDRFNKSRLLHSIPTASTRKNVTMFLSYDEGETWQPQRVIAPNTSAYSSITILPDGTIGVYLEEDGTAPYKMYFLNFSLGWLTGGKDIYTPAESLGTAELNSADQFKFYPNPVVSGGEITLQGSEKFIEASFYDMSGRKVGEVQVSSDRKVTVPKVTSGIYHTVLEGKDSKRSVKIFVK